MRENFTYGLTRGRWKRGIGGTVNPHCNRKSGCGNPPPKLPRQRSTLQRENILKYLGEEKKPSFRRRLQAAYEQPTYEKAKKRLEVIKRELALINKSAVESLEEGFEETLTLHRLGLFEKLGKSFKTTNCIENVNKLLALYTDRVTYWQSSDQRQRWVGTAMLEIEPGLNKVQGYKHMGSLRAAMKAFAAEEKLKQAA